MRPIYEKQEDLMKEEQVFRAFETSHNAVCVRLPQLSVVDRLICTRLNTVLYVMTSSSSGDAISYEGKCNLPSSSYC